MNEDSDSEILATVAFIFLIHCFVLKPLSSLLDHIPSSWALVEPLSKTQPVFNSAISTS